MPKRIPDDQIVDHFWSRVDKNGPVIRPDLGPCWIWTGSNNGHGYPVFGPRRFPRYAHHFAYGVAVGPIPKGEKIRHHCDNGMGGCVRPDHMTTGTQAQNIEDAVERGRFLKESCRKGHVYAEVGFTVYPGRPGRTKRQCRGCIRERLAAKRAVRLEAEAAHEAVTPKRVSYDELFRGSGFDLTDAF